MRPTISEQPEPRLEERHSVLELLDLEELDRDLYRGTLVFDDPYPLYGGQVAAQALRAAGGTVPEGRLPHSLHGYFLRGGDAARPTIFRVDRDRDGRSFSARRVVALQGGEVIFNMSVSFQQPAVDEDRQVHPAPDAPGPEALPDEEMPRLFSMDSRVPPQPYAAADFPTRLWSRCVEPLPDDDLLHACVLTYLSDISSGLTALHDGNARSGSSLDHAVWFHRPVRMDEWVLMDLVPLTVASGRGLYSGTIHTRDGALVASLTQECLFRTPRDRPAS
ncbi:acyl-CoA thioesterase [Actinomadura opuntiae]|uniref:acyl-CoA thioesterase n=1 Tax=Actinomadura sp. OS1-43 TaxID=604315 RepID=UPI00255B1486|nr:acyl-CoA thioesterase domain-containing protein [Actinomadura sp. OS1-43]MDL4817482.1 thioesterase family protein [Actinomadura sp. OS1-43]